MYIIDMRDLELDRTLNNSLGFYRYLLVFRTNLHDSDYIDMKQDIKNAWKCGALFSETSLMSF